MTKLWAKGYQLNQRIEAFMAGSDPVLDLKIAPYDCLASIAHVQMLVAIKLLSEVEGTELVQQLQHILQMLAKGSFNIELEQEDIHTAIENYLIQQLGDTGKKVHTGRSRNDQVLTALRLYTKHEIQEVFKSLINSLEVLTEFANKYADIPYVGRTHFQKAMPASIGLWAGAMLEALLDDSKLLLNCYELINQSPLGSAASYGVNLPLDRQLSSDLMGFAKVQNNVLYANNSRGKFESIVIHALSQIMLDLAKLATDVILFSVPEFGYFDLPEEFCPGSSIMPNKRNPDPFELIRAKSAVVQAKLIQTLEISRGLPSGYNRDFQETKEPLFTSFDITIQSLDVVALIMAKVGVNTNKCLHGFTSEVFATDHALQLTREGVPFRDAYVQTAQNLEQSRLGQLAISDPVLNIQAKTHLGATGSLGLEKIQQQIQELKQFKF